MPATNSRVLALAYPKARANRSYQHQKLTHTERGNSLGLCAPIPAVVHDNSQDRRLGRGDAPRSLSHCRSARAQLLPALSRRPVPEPLTGAGHTFPAERIRAARGGFLFARVPDCRPARAQSLRDKPAYQVAIAEIHHHSNLSLGLTDLTVSSEPKGLGNVRKAFGELRNV